MRFPQPAAAEAITERERTDKKTSLGSIAVVLISVANPTLPGNPGFQNTPLYTLLMNMGAVKPLLSSLQLINRLCWCEHLTYICAVAEKKMKYLF